MANCAFFRARACSSTRSSTGLREHASVLRVPSPNNYDYAVLQAAPLSKRFDDPAQASAGLLLGLIQNIKT